MPRHCLVVPIDQEIYLLQERLPGSPAAKPTPSLMDAIVQLNGRFSHLLADRPDVPGIPLCLTESGSPYPRHEVLAEHSNRSRRILSAIRAIGRRFPAEMTGDDLVHVDLTPSNILLDEAGTITGVVDWNLGAFRGDRHLAVVKTRFELEWGLHAPDPDPDTVNSARYRLLEQHDPARPTVSPPEKPLINFSAPSIKINNSSGWTTMWSAADRLDPAKGKVTKMSGYPVLLHTAIDAKDCRELGEFYRKLLGLRYRAGEEPPAGGSPDDADWLVLVDSAGARVLTIQEKKDTTPPTWPSEQVPMQMHMDFRVPTVEDLERHRARAEALGARILYDRSQDEGEPLYVFADPAGHPFCLLVQ